MPQTVKKYPTPPAVAADRTAPEPRPSHGEAEMVAAVRAGDLEAYALLYRLHEAAALKCAYGYCRTDADDLRAEAFTRMLEAIQAGRGPRGPVLPYLRRTIRNTAYARWRREAMVIPAGDSSVFDVCHTDSDPVQQHAELAMAAKAYAGLPDRWREVIAYTVIDDAKSLESVRPLLGISVPAVASLAYRARERLREAYLQLHIQYVAEDECRPFAERLGAYTRGRIGEAHRQRVSRHLSGCGRCADLFAMLEYVNATLARSPRRPRPSTVPVEPQSLWGETAVPQS
jgi:RNA polymerase sigma factor (sigma-70 family)